MNNSKTDIQQNYLVGNIRKDEEERIWVRVIEASAPQWPGMRQVNPTLEDVYLYTFEERKVREEGSV